MPQSSPVPSNPYTISHAFDYIEMDEASAKAAAEFALREKSGHSECSSNCKAWELLTRSLEL